MESRLKSEPESAGMEEGTALFISMPSPWNNVQFYLVTIDTTEFFTESELIVSDCFSPSLPLSFR